MSSAIEIRAFDPRDARAIAEVYTASTRQLVARDYTAAQIDRWAPAEIDHAAWEERLGESRPFVATMDGVIAGFLELLDDGLIDRCYVHPEFVRRGVATELMKRALEAARTCSMPKVCANVSLTAQPFFLRMGFRVTEERRAVVLGHVAPQAAMEREVLGRSEP